MARIALGVEYDGSAYHGWQSQEGLKTVQGCVEYAISYVANQPTTVTCAGRTDRGVHSFGQVIHFDSLALRDERAWLLGINSNLPRDIAVHWAQLMDNDFHARFSAIYRRYRYLIYNNPIRPGLLRNQTTWYLKKLDTEKMKEALSYLLGEHDFTSFRSSNCQAKTPIRTIQEASLSVSDDFIAIDFKANAFLHHMVRNIVGVLLRVGIKSAAPEWMRELIDLKDRSKAAPTAPPQGLYFIEAGYPESIKLPKTPLADTFLKL